MHPTLTPSSPATPTTAPTEPPHTPWVLKPGVTVWPQGVLADTLGGRIWQGLWQEAQQEVALKTTHPRHALGSPAWQVQAQALRREAALLAPWRDPSVLALWAWAELPSGPVLMLEKLHESLHARLARERPSRHEALHLGLQATQAVAKLHQARLKHLDIKPANFLMRPPGSGGPARLLLADFGSCQPLATAWHPPVGTPGWAAPEALVSQCPDGLAHTGPETDLYALGLLLFGLLVGRLPSPAQARFDKAAAATHALPPHRGASPSALFADPLDLSPLSPADHQALAHALAPPTRPGPAQHAGQALQAVLCQCLAPQAQHRPARTGPLASALAAALACGG